MPLKKYLTGAPGENTLELHKISEISRIGTTTVPASRPDNLAKL